MRCKKIIYFSIIFFAGIHFQHLKAQDLNINGDTIYVNMDAEIQIIFPTRPNSFKTVPNEDPAHSLKSLGAGVSIRTNMENTKPVNLQVSEGGRNHRFLLVFKKEIDYESELVYDYGTLKKLQEHLIKPPHGPTPASPVPPGPTPAPPEHAVPVDSSYYALLEQGDRYLKQGNYQEARSSFEKAHTLRPEAAVPLQKLEEIKKLLQPANDSRYITITAEAKTYFDQKKYTQARDAYKQALELRPGDLYATTQLATIDSILQKENLRKNTDLYSQYIKQGEAAYKLGNFKDARAAYEQALLLKPNDVTARDRLKLIEANADLESKYTAAIQEGDKFFLAGDYANAKNEYTKAIGFIKRPWPQEQLKKIAAQENIESQRVAQQALENNYDAAIQSADKFFTAGDYDNAKKEYTRAAALINKDWPKAQINTINKILTDRAAGAAAESQRQMRIKETEAKYNDLVKSADKEFDKSNYVKAKELYTAASSLKEETYAKERLGIIENILLKIAAAQKAKNDSILKAKETDNQYATAVKNAKTAYAATDLLKAKALYEEASGLKPLDQESQKQLKIINDKLEEIARETEINNKYDSLKALADSLVIAKMYDKATAAYNEALSIKPAETYPKKQLKYIQSELADIQKKNEIKRKQDEKQNYDELVSAAEKAVTDKRWKDADSAFTLAEAIHSDNETVRIRHANVRLQVLKENELLEKLRQEEEQKKAAQKKSKRKRSS